MPKTPALEPSPAYEHAHLIARDLLDNIGSQLGRVIRPDDPKLQWRHVHAMNQINALLSEITDAIDALNSRDRWEVG